MVAGFVTGTCIVGGAPTLSKAESVTAWRGAYEVPGANYSEPDAIFMENDYLKVTIGTDVPVSGQVIGLLYKPTEQELSPLMTNQGYFKDRYDAGRTVWRGAKDHKGKIVSQGDEKAVAEYSYLWSRGDGSALLVTKTYTLRSGASMLLVNWKLENVSDIETSVSAWWKHVGGVGPRGETVLGAPPLTLDESGHRQGGGTPVSNWAARRSSSEENTEAMPMVTAVYTFEDLVEYYTWAGGKTDDASDRRYSLEAVLSNVTLAPGESWDSTCALAMTANLKEPWYAAPELVAGVSVDSDEPRAGKELTVTLHIASALEMGARRLEGDVRRIDGDASITLPNREIELHAGKISEMTYRFTPPEDGVYELHIGVFDGQPLQPLGEDVSSQQRSIVVPVVVGPRPERVVRAWERGESLWLEREGREIDPWRTLVRDRRMNAAQVLVPRRIYPEDKIVYGKGRSLFSWFRRGSGGGEPAYLRLAANQHESLQFSVDFDSVADVMDLSVEAGKLTDDAGNALDDVRLFEVIYLTTTTPSKYDRDFHVGHYPDPLFELGWADEIADSPMGSRNIGIMEAAKRRVFWLTVKTPEDAAPGIYRGAVKLRLGDEYSTAFPIEVQVSDFALPARPSYIPSTGMVGWGSRNTYANFGLTDADRDRLVNRWGHGMDGFRRLILEYGWSPTMYSGLNFWREYYDYGRGVTTFQNGSQRGTETHDWLEETGNMEYAWVYAPFDEHTNAQVPDVVEWAKGFREKSDIPIGDCYYGNNVDPLIDLVDVWIGQNPRADHWGEPTGPFGWGHKAVEAKERGVKFFAVNARLQWFLELEPETGRTQFWDDFAVGYDGRYVYSTCRWTDDLYVENYTAGQGNYLGSVTYKSPHGITTSIRMESLRDGVYDYDYLTLLREVVEARRAEGGEAAEDLKPQIEAAESILYDRDIAGRVRSASELYEMREKIADLIEKLY